MNRPRRIAVLTGARSEFGLLLPLLRILHNDARCTLQLMVTGMHLSPRFGNTIDEIRASGVPISCEIPCLEDGDTPLDSARATANLTARLASSLIELAPDIIVLLGDRFEVLGAATAALLLRIPICHIHGGESTEGLIDEAVRHAVSKMAALHAVAAEPYRARLIAMGEPPERVHVVGALGLDAIRVRAPLSRMQLLADLGLVDRGNLALVTFHPVTLLPGESLHQVKALCAAMAHLETLLITAPNADAENHDITKALNDFTAQHGNAIFVKSLGQQRYLSAMAGANVMIGNSSSGIIEAPSFRLPVVNIGERQQGRLRHANIIDCDATVSSISLALNQVLAPEFRVGLSHMSLHFGDGHAAERVARLLMDQPVPSLIKRFHDGLDFQHLVAASGLRS